MALQHNSKVQLDYISMNKKLINCSLNWEAYTSFEELSSDRRIVLQRYEEIRNKSTQK